MPALGSRRGALALALAAALVAGACSDDSGPDEGAGTASSEADGSVVLAPGPAVPADIADGCGRQAVTDPDDLSAGRVVARCGEGAPAAAPLPTATTLRVAVPEEPGPELAPLFAADALGEFEAENLTVELVPLDDRAAMEAIDAGTVDVAVGPLGGAYLDVLEAGSGARLVMGGVVASYPNDLGRPQTGLWVRDDALQSEEDPGDLGNLELQRVGMPNGVRSPAAYPVDLAFSQTDITLNEVALTDSFDLDAAAELRDGAIAAAWLDGAEWAEVAGEAGIRLRATLPASESIDGTVVAARLLGADREVGLAYARAIIRTVNTHLTGDYREDDEVVAAIAEGTGLAEGTVRDDLPPLLFDWELRTGTMGRIEEALLRLGGVGYDAPTDPDTHLDRTLAADAVGASGADS